MNNSVIDWVLHVLEYRDIYRVCTDVSPSDFINVNISQKQSTGKTDKPNLTQEVSMYESNSSSFNV